MLKSMVFIDYQNFKISLGTFCESQGVDPIEVDYYSLALNLSKRLKMKQWLMKAFLFACRPCDDLLSLPDYKKAYDWLCSIKGNEFFEVVEGTQEIRPMKKGLRVDLSNPKTFKTKEKGTDVNIAVHMLNKAYHNSYDVSILVSGDADYIPIVETLHSMGKIVVIASLPQQNIEKYKDLIDARIEMDLDFLYSCRPDNI